MEHYNSKEAEKLYWMKLAKSLTDTLTQNYVKAVPYQVKKIAVKDAYTAWVSGCRKTKKSGKPFSLSFRARKDYVQTLFIPKSAIKENGIYHTILGNLRFSETQWLNGEFGDCRLTRDKGRYYLCIPTKEKVTMAKRDNQAFDVVALDPGIRTFVTYFSVNGHFGNVGYHAFEKIVKKCTRLDKTISSIAKEKDYHKQRNLKRAANRLRWRIHDMVDQLHWETITFLTDNFKVIYLPTFETSDMVRKSRRHLRSKSVRSLLGFRFYEFSQRLANKCAEKGASLIRCNEAYTSNTNSFTGEIMPKLGNKEWFKYDGVTVNRDINGARNILLRAMRDASAIA